MAEKKLRYIGKVKEIQSKNGPFKKIYIDNALPKETADGSLDPYYKGTLIWVDAETGKQYVVKQLGIGVPKNGIDPKALANGFIANITIDINDEYAVQEASS